MNDKKYRKSATIKSYNLLKPETSHLCYLATFLTLVSFYVSYLDSTSNGSESVNDYSQTVWDSMSFGSALSSLTSNDADQPFSSEGNAECRDYDRDIFGDIPLKEGLQHIGTRNENIDENNAFLHVLNTRLEIVFQLYGIFAFHGGLLRTQSKYANNHIVVIPNNAIKSGKVSEKMIQGLEAAGMKVVEFDSSQIDSKTPANASEHMHGIHAFKLTEYDRIVMIEHRQQILNSIDNIFTFAAPSAPPERWNGMESNTACFMFEPSEETYEKLVNSLHKTADWINTGNNNVDAFNTDRGTFQGYLNSVFWHIDSNLAPIYQLGHQWALSTRKLSSERSRYFMEWRPSMIKMVEFVDEYPVDTSSRRKYKERIEKLESGQKSKVDWFATKMAEYTAQFWLDFQRSFEKCGPLCLKVGFNCDSEVAAAQKYRDAVSEPFPPKK